MSTLEFNDALINLEHYLKSFAYGFTRNSEDAEDLTQETMLKALKYRSQYTPKTNFKAWVFTIMRNVFINQYRRKLKAATIFDSSKELYLLQKSDETYSTPMDYMLGKDLGTQLNKLEDEYKRPFTMHYEGYKYQEIAENLNIPIGTVKSRIFIARKKLMDSLPHYKYSN
ncbi:MAG: RNA polymerase sigma factor [Bacteroidota bacterium]